MTNSTHFTYTEVKDIKAFCENLFSEPSWRDVVEQLAYVHSYDFEVENVRFIKSDSIDEVQKNELESDLYVLGCFNADFLSEIIDIDSDVIKAMQDAEAFEAVGKLIISMGALSELQEQYASADGYGHHFNHHDFSEDELRIDGQLWHVFDNH